MIADKTADMINNLIAVYGQSSDIVSCFVTLVSEFHAFRITEDDLEEAYELFME